MAKILETTTRTGGFNSGPVYRVRPLADGEAAPAGSRPVVVTTNDFDWVGGSDPQAEAAIAAADSYGKPAQGATADQAAAPAQQEGN